MAAYSIDLRQKLLDAYERQLGSQRTLAHTFGVSLAFVEQVRRQHRTTGTMAPKPHGGGQRPRLDEATHVVLRQRVRDNPDRTLHELCTRLAAEMDRGVSVSTMRRLLQRLDWPRQKRRSTRRSVTRRVSRKRGRTTWSGSNRSTLST
jgi:transposase